jgi:membrane-bound metal-dependent hydrolase YbcI (DUF457 family)
MLKRFVYRLLFIAGMIAVANLPDWPIAGWGHYRYHISHSIIVNGLAMVSLGLAVGAFEGRIVQKYPLVAIGITVAWLSHFLLDSLYVNTSLEMFWPVSAAGVSLPVPWLKTMPHVPPPFDAQVLRVFALEVLTFGPPLVLALVLRRKATNYTANR